MKPSKPYKHYAGKSGLLCAIEKAGSQTILARLLGVSQKTISSWLALDNVPPAPPTNANTGIARAIAAAGSQAALADTLGVKPQQVSFWLRQGFVPAGRAAEIEHQFGVPRLDLVSDKIRNLSPGWGML